MSLLTQDKTPLTVHGNIDKYVQLQMTDRAQDRIYDDF